MISAQTPLKPQLEALTSVYPTGGTVFTYPLMESMRELSQTRSQGKVLIMITDGCVNNVEDIASSAKIVSSGENGGVQCIGIGVGNTSVKQIFANAVELNSSATNLASVLFDRTQKILDVA